MSADLGPVSKRRKAIPVGVKLDVVLRQNGKCTQCGEWLGPLPGLNFDHRPALSARPWIAENCDFDPPQNDPAHIQALHISCHKTRTFGRGGERRISTRDSDIGEPARIRSISEEHAAFQRRVLAKVTGEDDPAPAKTKRKHKIPSRPFSAGKRPFPKRGKQHAT